MRSGVECETNTLPLHVNNEYGCESFSNSTNKKGIQSNDRLIGIHALKLKKSLSHHQSYPGSTFDNCEYIISAGEDQNMPSLAAYIADYD